MNKYTYYKVLQLNYGQGWEDTCQYPCNSQGVMLGEDRKELRDDLTAYADNQPEYARRVIRRKELNVTN